MVLFAQKFIVIMKRQIIKAKESNTAYRNKYGRKIFLLWMKMGYILNLTSSGETGVAASQIQRPAVTT